MAASEAEEKRTLAGNRKLSYQVSPPSVGDWRKILSEGVYYGRVRTNFFRWNWEDENGASRDSHSILGAGGSLIYRTAQWQGLSADLGLYVTTNPLFRPDRDEVGELKAGKDVISRYEVSRGGSYHEVVPGQANLSYAADGFELRAGRQLYESAFTASNDTKMIPNTFDGVTGEWQAAERTRVRFAWLDRQKLRDHTEAHDVITFRNAAGESWANQDDSAIHKGLSYANFRAAGESTSHDLWIGSLSHRFANDLNVVASGLVLPEVLNQAVIELGYSREIGDWRLKPGLRYFHQFDEGGGAIGGASLDGDVNSGAPGGYRDPDQLDASLLGLRLVLDNPDRSVQTLIGYTRVADDADIVAPWRSFPTGGYTRAMGQYNWRADTDSYLLQFKFDFEKLARIKGLDGMLRYARMDFDEGKGYTDREILHLDFIQQFTALPGFELRLRAAFVTDDGPTDYQEYRLETNYLF